MDFRSETRTVGFGLLAAASAFAGLYAAAFGSPLFVSSGYTSNPSSTAAWLATGFVFAPALAVYFIVNLVAWRLRRDEPALVAAIGAGLGGAVALSGSFVASGLFLFVGWFLFPWTFAYAAMVLPNLVRGSSARASAVALHVGAATAIYAPLIAWTLYNAFDTSAERAGFREGAGWLENFPSAIVLSILYAILIIASLGTMQSSGLGSGSGQPGSTGPGSETVKRA